MCDSITWDCEVESVVKINQLNIRLLCFASCTEISQSNELSKSTNYSLHDPKVSLGSVY